jgi:hypothetical protein
MGTIEKYLNVTSVLDTCIVVSKRAVFGICVNGIWAGVWARGWVQRLPGFMRESQDFVGEDGVFII